MCEHNVLLQILFGLGGIFIGSVLLIGFLYFMERRKNK